MNLRLATIFLLFVTVTLSSSFSWSNADLHTPNSKPKTSNLTFIDFKILERNERQVRLSAFTDNSGIKQVTDISCTIEGDSMLFRITVLPNDRNVNLYYKSSIKLK
jgi:hypothetical protein